MLCGRLIVAELNEVAVFFYSEVILQERDRRIIYAVRVAVDRCFSAAKLVRKGHTVKDGSK